MLLKGHKGPGNLRGHVIEECMKCEILKASCPGYDVRKLHIFGVWRFPETFHSINASVRGKL